MHPRSGLNLTLYRAYNPSIGRWLSRDPLEELFTQIQLRQIPAGVFAINTVSLGDYQRFAFSQTSNSNLYAYVGNDPVLFAINTKDCLGFLSAVDSHMGQSVFNLLQA
jgi:uncharacterized protein RhaS with RHS repeats